MDPFPEDIVRFLDSHVESIDRLEILRVLGEDPAREWGVAALAAEIQAEPQSLATHLEALLRRGLLSVETRERDRFYRYNSANPELDSLVQRLLQLYRERPVTMIKLVYARADAVRALAEAFRLRKEGS